MAKPDYMVTGVDPDLVRIIKDGAVFLREVGTSDVPTGENWMPDDANGTQLGYYTEEGVEITPNPGDTTELVGHNGDILIAEQDPGYWGINVSGLQSNEVNVGAYFDTEVASDGSITVTKASANKRWDMVIAGWDQKDRMIVVHFPNVQLESRESFQLNRTTLLALSMTFRTFMGRAETPYHLKAWGLVADLPEPEEP